MISTLSEAFPNHVESGLRAAETELDARLTAVAEKCCGAHRRLIPQAQEMIATQIRATLATQEGFGSEPVSPIEELRQTKRLAEIAEVLLANLVPPNLRGARRNESGKSNTELGETLKQKYAMWKELHTSKTEKPSAFNTSMQRRMASLEQQLMTLVFRLQGISGNLAKQQAKNSPFRKEDVESALSTLGSPEATETTEDELVVIRECTKSTLQSTLAALGEPVTSQYVHAAKKGEACKSISQQLFDATIGHFIQNELAHAVVRIQKIHQEQVGVHHIIFAVPIGNEYHVVNTFRMPNTWRYLRHTYGSLRGTSARRREVDDILCNNVIEQFEQTGIATNRYRPIERLHILTYYSRLCMEHMRPIVGELNRIDQGKGKVKAPKKGAIIEKEVLHFRGCLQQSIAVLITLALKHPLPAGGLREWLENILEDNGEATDMELCERIFTACEERYQALKTDEDRDRKEGLSIKISAEIQEEIMKKRRRRRRCARRKSQKKS